MLTEMANEEVDNYRHDRDVTPKDMVSPPVVA